MIRAHIDSLLMMSQARAILNEMGRFTTRRSHHQEIDFK
jgi:hypothetical protein